MDQRLFYLLNKARHRVYRVADKHCEDTLNVSVTQLGALMVVAGDEGCQLKELASSLNLNNSALTGLAGRMEAKGLIQRRPCEQDGRASRLFLTNSGRERIENARPLIAMLNGRMTEGFSDDEVTVVLRFLNRLVDEF